MQPTDIVDTQTLRFRRAIKEIKDVHDICKKLVSDNDERNKKDAEITKKLNDEAPFKHRELTESGQGWRSNRSTGFMSSLIKRMSPQYKQAVDQARLLTSARLQETGAKAEQKNETFRLEITKLVRSWPKWNQLLTQIIFENLVFGSSVACWTDEMDWRPMFARRDYSFFPDGCPQDAKDVPLWCLKQNFMIYELADKLVEPEISSASGWQIENLVKAINESKPEDRRSGGTSNFRELEDTVRETTIGSSYCQNVKVVQTHHLFIKEYNGKVSHFLVREDNGDLLFGRLDRYESMEECLTLFTIEEGNGKFYGSKGAGRVLYNTHSSAERSRNLIMDNLYLAGLMILQAKNKGKRAVSIDVTHPFCVVPEDFEVVNMNIKVNPDAFFAIDRHMTSIAEMQIGAFMPSMQLSSEGEKRTASEINYTASIEQQIREGVISRFYNQLMNLVYQMQRRICSEDNIIQARAMTIEEDRNKTSRISRRKAEFLKRLGESVEGIPVIDESNLPNKEAVECCYNMLREGLEPEDIFELANCPPQQVTQDMTEKLANAFMQISAQYTGNPNIDQQKLMERNLASQVGHDIAKELMIPQEDQTVMAEATRQQLIELGPLFQGEQIEVSPRDNHVIHMDVLMGKAGQLMSQITPDSVNEMTMMVIQNVAQHYMGHLQGAIASGMKEDELKKYQEFADKVQGLISQATMMMQQIPPQPQLPPGATPMPDVATIPQPGEQQRMMPNQPLPPSQGMPLTQGPLDMTVPVGQS